MEDNRIQNQIAIYMTNKKLCEFTDKLKPAPIEYYAHMHAQGEEQADGIRAYSCIGVVLQDYSNGTGDKTVRVTANLSPGFFPFVLSRMQNDLDRFDFTEDKIFGEPDEHGLSTVTKLSVKRASVGNDGKPRNYPWCEGGLNLFTKPQLFFKGDRFRIFGVFAYKNTLENFYGIGYSTNKDYPRGEDTSEYRYSGVQVNPWFLFRLGKSNFFAGPQIDFNYDKITKPAAGMIEQPSYIAAGGTDHGYSNLSSGVGFLLTYDTRDVPANAYRGTYLDFRGMMYNKAFGSDNNFYRLEIDYRQYKTLGKRKVLAWTVQTKNVFGNVPLTKYALSGTPFDLRGYYMGQFRDKSSHVMMAEYRQMINTDKSNWVKKMLNHVGYVAWGGCGFMGPTPGKIEGVLPNLGLGLRIEVQPRMNVRLDFGRDMVNKQNLFYFNMTEAF